MPNTLIKKKVFKKQRLAPIQNINLFQIGRVRPTSKILVAIKCRATLKTGQIYSHLLLKKYGKVDVSGLGSHNMLLKTGKGKHISLSVIH